MRELENIEPQLVAANVSLRDVLTRLNDSLFQFLLVVDEARHLIGTVTDGDIRRSILRGVTLDEPISGVMFREPKATRRGAEDFELLLREVPFVPVLDERNSVVSVVLRGDPPEEIEEAVIMAGGLGSRLGKLTESTPKPLLAVGGKPILGRIIDRLEASGVRRVWIAVNHLAEQVESFIATRKNIASIDFLREDERLGTAGALSLLPKSADGPVLIMNGDVLTNIDLGALLSFHRLHNHDGTIAVAQHQVRLPFGVVKHDSTGGFLSLEEKPLISHFVAAGVYLFTREILGLSGSKGRQDMPDLINHAKDIGLGVGLFPIHEYWADVGRPEDLVAAERHYADGAEDER